MPSTLQGPCWSPVVVVVNSGVDKSGMEFEELIDMFIQSDGFSFSGLGTGTVDSDLCPLISCELKRCVNFFTSDFFFFFLSSTLVPVTLQPACSYWI